MKPGGVWDFIMHGPDGKDYKNTCIYSEVTPPERLAYSHGPGPLFQVLVIFEDVGGKTELTMQLTFESVEQRDRTIKQVGAIEGGQQTLGRLTEYLANPKNVL